MKNQRILKGAIIGYGFISSKGHMPAYLKRLETSEDVEIIAICDICPDRIKDVPAGIKFYTDYQELLEKEHPFLDFIDVSTHAASHYEIAKKGLELGLHVLCEKPLTTSFAEANDLIKTAVLAKRVLFPCHNYKHSPVVKAISSVIESGQIGKIKSVSINTFRNTHAVGTKEWKPDWRRSTKYSGGGIAMDHGSHGLYLIFDWMKAYPKSVTAKGFNLSFPKYDTEDNFFGVYEFENGMANVHLTWTAGVRKVIYTLQGEKGALTIDDDQVELAILKSSDTESSSYKAEWDIKKYSITSDWMDSSHVNWFNSMFDDFKRAILEDNFLNKDIMDAYFCIQTIMKSYESMNNNSLTLPLENQFPKFL